MMEPVSAGRGRATVLAVALPVSWRDVGGFSSLAEILPADEAGNATSGTVTARESSGNVVLNAADGSLIALLGWTTWWWSAPPISPWSPDVTGPNRSRTWWRLSPQHLVTDSPEASGHP